MSKFHICLLTLFCASVIASEAQPRVAVMPFRNMDGRMQFDPYSKTLADSLRTMLMHSEAGQGRFYMIPGDSITAVLATINTDPNNPQYDSDLWFAIEKLQADYVVWGNFNVQGEKFLINAYVYDFETKLADPANQAKNLYKAPEQALETVPVMTRKLLPALLK